MVSLYVFYNSFQILCAISKHPASYMTRDITMLPTCPLRSIPVGRRWYWTIIAAEDGVSNMIE
jgi:hypothetical protein